MKHGKNKLENGYCLVWYVLKQKFVMKSLIQKNDDIYFLKQKTTFKAILQ